MFHINGGKVAFIKYIDAGALRLKDWAFTLLGLEAFAIMYSLGAPTKANLVSSCYLTAPRENHNATLGSFLRWHLQ